MCEQKRKSKVVHTKHTVCSAQQCANQTRHQTSRKESVIDRETTARRERRGGGDKAAKNTEKDERHKRE